MIGPNRKAVTVDGIYYKSMSDAANAFGMSVQGALYRFNSDKYSTWIYI